MEIETLDPSLAGIHTVFWARVRRVLTELPLGTFHLCLFASGVAGRLCTIRKPLEAIARLDTTISRQCSRLR
jgi:hypothetical protein